ncbi:MAG TPA: cbb3-type cytochrome c oxidase subunit 3 [Variovorax sp.]|nr:cbb3-type cytochrome c oxidase subunit 3 [Variovorax sp.]
MDLNTLRIIATVACFVVFLGIVGWTYTRRFDEAARLPLEQD